MSARRLNTGIRSGTERSKALHEAIRSYNSARGAAMKRLTGSSHRLPSNIRAGVAGSD